MKSPLLVAVSALALATVPAPAEAQHMPGMTMPMPEQPKKKPATKKKAPLVKKKPRAAESLKPATEPKTESMPSVPMPENADTMNHTQQAPAPTMPMDHSQMDHPSTDRSMHSMVHGRASHEMSMSGALGPYPMTREASGTAWQPDTSTDMGVMGMSGDWTLMAHGIVDLVFDHQASPRGDDKAFVSGMVMGMARRPLGNGTLQFRVSLSPDPLMGPSGYPLLLASGETANGRDRLIDRQHPHDFFMELATSVSQNIGSKSSVFVYGGLPGEPAFGPPAFMHREAILDSPEAPISHHWLDSTHISFGVVTAGLILDRVKIEASHFNAREPDQHRLNIETGPLDSTAVRLSWNPTSELALQGSWGHFVDPEQLEPGVDQKRWSASLLYARELVPGWKFAGAMAWGRKTADGHSDNAYVAEASLKYSLWTVYGRAEMTENRELLDVDQHGPAFRVGKASLGAVRDFRIAKSLLLGAGGQVALNFVPDGLASLYGGNHPIGAMAFVRLKLAD